MKCPNCDDGQRVLIPVCVRMTGDRAGLTEDEFQAICDSISTCNACGGTGEITEEKAVWIELGRAMRHRRVRMGVGLGRAAIKLRILPSVLCSMENGMIKPDPSILDKLGEE